MNIKNNHGKHIRVGHSIDVVIFELSITDQMLAVIYQALDQMPYAVAAPLINEINQQIVALRKHEADELENQRSPNFPLAPVA